MLEASGPEFVRYMSPILRVIASLGGSARPAEVIRTVAADVGASEEAQSRLLRSGQRSFDNKVHWARFYLARAGLLDASTRGVWSLSEQGRENIGLTQEQALEIFKRIHREFQGERETQSPETDEQVLAPVSDADPIAGIQDFRREFLERLQALPPSGFERFARRLLLESGFQEVVITGRSGDGGIDGIGRLQVNSLVSTKVLFQCKRYQGSVSANTVRDFRGAMAGRSENGIVITTGTFTRSAMDEALRDGVPPIELVDGGRLVELCEELRIGLRPVTTFEVDSRFFADFETAIEE